MGNKLPAFGMPSPGFGTPLRPNDIGKQISRLSDRPMRLTEARAAEAKTKMQSTLNDKPEPQVKKKRKSKQRKTATAKGDASYTPYGLLDDNSSSSSSDSFQGQETERQLGIVPNRRGEPITFSYQGETPLSVMQLEDNYTPPFIASLSTASFQSSMKMTWNLANYSSVFVRIPSLSEVAGQLDVIYERYSRMIIAKIRSGIITSWTKDNFKFYLRDVCALLEAYYTVDSILAYEGSTNEPDRNPILITMKQQYSDFAIQVVHDKARSILKNTWFPEHFSKLIRWTYQNYKIGPAYQTSNYRYFPSSNWVQYSGEAFNTASVISYYNGLIDAVTTVTNRNIISLLSATIPDGIIGSLPDSCNRAVYDRQHHEGYANQGIAWNDGSNVLQGFPSTTVNGYTIYGSPVNTNEAGAFPFVLSTTYDATNKLFRNGMLHPVPLTKKQDGTTGASWAFQTNKFYAHTANEGDSGFITHARNWNLQSDVTPTLDVHTQKVDASAANYAASNGKVCVSMVKGNYQSLYFNTSDSRVLIIREFLNWLFYLS